jgi:hypothetical protein
MLGGAAIFQSLPFVVHGKLTPGETIEKKYDVSYEI